MTGYGNRKLLIQCSVINTTVTYLRLFVGVTTFISTRGQVTGTKESGKVRQRSEYKGKEIIKDNIATLRKPTNRITVRKEFDSSSYTIYRFAEDFGMHDSFIPALDGLTNIGETARRKVIWAAGSMTGSYCSIDLRTGIHHGPVKVD